MEDLHRADLLDDGPNTVAHNSVLDALSKTTESNAVARAEVILCKMSKSRITRLHPDMFTYNSMLNVYASHQEGEKAEKLLDEIVDLQKAGKLSAGPNSYTYRIVIDALAKSGNGSRAEQLLHRMHKFAVRPNKFHYTGVLSGYAREGKTADAERLLQEMLQAYKVGYLEEAPSIVAYNCAMHAWANSGELDAPFRACALFNRILETGVTPNVITYNCLLCACGNQGKAKETERLLKQMHDLYDAGKLEAPPNTISYNCALDALAKSGDRVWTVLRAESLVNKMKDLYRTTQRADIKPNMITYRSLLRCYANWKLLEDAEKLLERMQSLYEMKKLEYGPDRQSYQTVILALEKSDEKDATERAAKLRQKVESIYGEGGWQQETLIEIDQVGALLEYMND
jgi:pentatricopeptide repeat protein